MDAEYRIRIVADPGNSSSTLAGITDDTRKITEATGELSGSQEKLAETGERAGKVLGSLRSAHHALAGIIELSEGGEAAIGGLAAQGRVATEIFEGMLGPLAPLLLVITTLTQLAIPMFEKWEEHQKKIEDGKGSVDDYAQKWTEASGEIVSALGQIIKAQEQVIKQDEKDLANIKEKAALQKAQVKLDQDSAINILHQKYVQDLQNPDLTAAQRDQLTKKFNAAKDDIKDETEVKTAQVEAEEKADTYYTLQKQEPEQETFVERNQKVVDDLGPLVQQARETLEGLGLSLSNDKDGKKTIIGQNGESGEDVLKALVARLPTAEKYNEQVQHLRAAGHSGGITDKYASQVQAATDKLKKQIDDLTSALKYSQFGDALKQAQDNLEKGKDALQKTRDALPKATEEFKQSGQAYDLAKGNAKADHDERAATQAAEDREAKAKTAFEDRESLRREQIDDLETQLKLVAPTDDAKRGNLEKQKAAIESEGIRDKANTDLAAGTIRVPQYNELIEHAKNILIGANAEAQHQMTEENNRVLEKQAQGIEELIRATKNPALIEEMRRLIAQSGKDGASLVAGLNAIAHGKPLPGAAAPSTAPIPLSPQAEHDQWRRSQKSGTNPPQEPPAAAAAPTPPRPNVPPLQGAAKKTPPSDHHDDSADALHAAAGSLASANRSISSQAAAIQHVTEQATLIATNVVRGMGAQEARLQKLTASVQKLSNSINSLKSNHQS